MSSDPISLRSDEWMVPRRGTPAWVMSCVFHALVFAALCWLVQVAPRGADDEPDRAASIVLVQNQNDRREYLTEQDLASAGGLPSTLSGATTDNPLPSNAEVPVELAGVLPSGKDFVGIGGDIGNLLPGADGLIDGPRPGKFSGNQVQTGVFGVQGIGSKFIYVFDRSNSMSGHGGKPLAAAKAELIKSLAALQSVHQFQIVFYNQRPHVFNPFPDRAAQMIFGTERDKEAAIDFVRRVVADGSTEHMQALKMAVNLGPDVIFFLTDAAEPKLTESDFKLISRWNRANASINTIEFGAGPFRGGENFLVRLAEQNNGRHVYVDVTRLPEKE